MSTETEKSYDEKRREYEQRIQEARVRGDRFTEQQLQQELNYMDDAHLRERTVTEVRVDAPNLK